MLTAERDFVGYGMNMPKVQWPDNARLAVSLVLNLEEGAEANPIYGDDHAEPIGEGFLVPRGYRDLRNESYFDYGPRVGFGRLLDIFARHDVKVTFYICARALEEHPDLGPLITANGHEPAGHGYRWIPSHNLGREEERRQLHKAVEIIHRLTGERPVGWYARGPSVHTRDLVVEEGGFVYDSNSFADDLPYFTNVGAVKWLVIPYSIELNDIKFNTAPGYSDPDDFFMQLKSGFDRLYEEGTQFPQMLSVGMHTRWSGRPGRAAAVEKFIRYAKGHPGVWFARRIDIARWWLKHYDPVRTDAAAAGAIETPLET